MTDTVTEAGLPADIAEAVIRMGRVEWGVTEVQDDEAHVADFANSLRLTREHFDLDGPRALQGVYLEGTGTVLCHTGTSPNSGNNAQAIAGAWNWLVTLAMRSASPVDGEVVERVARALRDEADRKLNANAVNTYPPSKVEDYVDFALAALTAMKGNDRG